MRRTGQILASLSLLILGAHFLRSGSGLLLLGCLALLVLAWVPRIWATRLVQGGLLLGAFEWLGTALLLVNERQASGLPWHRLAVILGSVGLVALLALILLFSRTPRREPA